MIAFVNDRLVHNDGSRLAEQGDRHRPADCRAQYPDPSVST